MIGGVSLKVLLPSVLHALSVFLTAHGLDVPTSPHTTLYRIEISGSVYYSRTYQCVKKRNSYTIVYRDDNGARQFAFIEYFLHLHQRVIAVLTPLRPLQVTCKSHFGLTTNAVDYSALISPVSIENTCKLCFVEDILTKTLFLDFGSCH